MRRFANQLRHVLTTYATRRLAIFLTSLGLAILMATQIAMLANTHNALKVAKAAASLAGLPAFVLPMLLVWHAKTQFAHPRAVLLPNFCGPHLAIPAAVLAILLLAFPVLVANWTNCDPLGLPAFACALAVPAIWGLQLNRTLGTFVALILIVSTARSDAFSRWWVVPNHELIAVRLLIILAGWTAAAAWLWRLCQLREEMGDYELPATGHSSRPSRAERAAMGALVARQFTRNPVLTAIADWWSARRNVTDCGNLWGRMRLLDYGLAAWPVEFWTLAVAGLLLAIGIAGGELIPDGSRMILHFQVGIILLALLNALPRAIFVGHRPLVGGELMFPMTRVELIDGLFAAVARRLGVFGIVLHLVALTIIIQYPLESTTLSVVGTFVVFSATVAVIMFGFGAYLATWSSRLLELFAYGLAFSHLFGLLALWTWTAEHLGAFPVFLLAVLHLLVGQAIIRIAKHAWLNLELG